MNNNRIDELMSLDPLDMTADDLDEIIARHRANRGLDAKAKKETGPKVSLAGLLDRMVSKPQATPPVARRKL